MWNGFAHHPKTDVLHGMIPAILWDCKVYAIETAFKIEGFARRSALQKPKLTAACPSTISMGTGPYQLDG